MKVKVYILLCFCAVLKVASAQTVEEVVMQLPRLVIDRASDSAQLMADRKSMLVSSSASIVEVDSAHRFMHLGVPQPSKKVLQLRLLQNVQKETFVAVSEYAANLDCDQYRFTIYKQQGKQWIDVTQQAMPIIYFFLCIPESDPAPNTKICFDMNSNWYYNLRDTRMTAEPVALKNAVCMEQSVRDIATKEGKPALDAAMKYYYEVINNRPYKKIYLQWQADKSAYVIIEKK